MSVAPRIALEDLGVYDITPAEGLPGHYVVDVNGQVELEATLSELENVGLNLLALVSGQRLDAARQLGGLL